ncbi:hypothetical protein [Enhygromyxa salina]|uniref:hypothetical protein n=1 Tax=Enhygromyxa salina TaxID=215803 RepID=UPI0011BABB5D|nr:hypothetical protein [Enhygromyxa salina]
MTGYIKTEKYSAKMRQRIVRPAQRQLLISRIAGSVQEKDMTLPPNCGGLGRIRHFYKGSGGEGWPATPLPIVPALSSLGREQSDSLTAEVFQNAGCNWRCWYCFVPFELLDGREAHGEWVNAGELVDRYIAEPDATRPAMIVLSGGQPDLCPEWVPWTMEALRARNLEGKVYLWSDDNLSTDYFWTYLTEEQRILVATFKGYGRVACFKGFDNESFAFNTGAAPKLFDQQFDLFARLLATGVDLYAYVTLTGPSVHNIDDRVARFVDRLQSVHPNLPLRTAPLRVVTFGVVGERLRGPLVRIRDDAERATEEVQVRAIAAWMRELEARFDGEARATPIDRVTIR